LVRQPGLTVFLATSTSLGWLTASLRRSRQRALIDAEEQTSLAATMREQARSVERDRSFLEQAQRLAQLGSWDWDMATDQIVWSDELYRLYGMEPARPITYESYVARIHPEDRDLVASTIGDARATGMPFSFEHRVVHPDGSVRWLHGRGSVISGPDGSPIRMLGSSQDVTERRRANEAQRMLAEAADVLGTLDQAQTVRAVADLAVKHLCDWAVVALGDETGHVTETATAHRVPYRRADVDAYMAANPLRIEQRLGVPEVLRTGRPELHATVSRALLRRAGRTDEVLRLAERLGARSAMIVPMIARGRMIGAISLVSAESGHRFTDDDLFAAQRLAERGAIALDNARLFEEVQRAGAVARDANLAKTEFLAAMSHELRTPLNAIAGYAQLLELGIKGPVTEPQRLMLERIGRSQRQLQGLIEDVLGFAKLEMGQLQFRIADVHLDEALSYAADLIASTAEAKGQEYRYERCDPEVTVRADEDRLAQIVLNLLNNAVKFTPAGGKISISAGADAGVVRVAVQDTGPGIPSDQLEAIFEPFVQLERSNERPSGSGLGLAIARDLARAMAGDLTVDSEPGRGSTFTLSLPRGGRAAESTASASISTSMSGWISLRISTMVVVGGWAPKTSA
jgi:PAS domain S-box-containing protein